MEKLLGFTIILSFLSLLTLIFCINQEINTINRHQPKRRKSKKRKTTIEKNKLLILSNLENKLFSMVGDPSAAIRLVDNIQIKNPDRDEIWCWEKAILDLERDRRL